MFKIDRNFIEKLRILRAKRNITIEEASKQIGISRRTYGLIENEKVNSIKKTVYTKLVEWLMKGDD